MAVFRVERTRDYTVMCNHHLKDTGLSLKSKGLLSMMLSLPDTWNYTTRGLAAICKEGVDAIGSAVRELEKAGYIVRRQLRGADGRITDTEYVIYERPLGRGGPDTPPPGPGGPQPEGPGAAFPVPENPYVDGPEAAAPYAGKPAQLNIDQVSTDQKNTYLSRPTEGTPAPPRGGGAFCADDVRAARERMAVIREAGDQFLKRPGVTPVSSRELRVPVSEIVPNKIEKHAKKKKLEVER